MAIRLVLADDHPIVLDGLAGLFGLTGEFQIVARCVSGTEALEAVRKHRPDVLILDVQMTPMDGLTVLRRLQAEGPPTRSVVLSAALDERQVIEALRLGARGIVLKDLAPSQLIECVREVHRGQQWIEKRLSGLALDRLLAQDAAERKAGGLLTEREIELVRLVASGLRNKEIADRLDISEGTVKTHLYNVYRKVGVGTRVELTLYAKRCGLA